MKKQKQIVFDNTCGCIVDLGLLSRALIWYTDGDRLRPKGRIYLQQGYPSVSYGGSYVSVHRLIAMYSRREKTLSTMVCHHIDGNMLNASVDNLEVMPIGLHLALHLTGTKHSDEARHKMSESHTGMKYSDEMREKLRVANTGKVMSDETKRKISNTKKGTIFTEEAKRKMSVSAKKRWSTVPPPKKDFNLHLTSAPE